MRNPTLAVLLAALSAGPALAQPPVKITSAKIGLPPGRFVAERDDSGSAAYVAKNNTWAPVYIDLEIAREVRAKAAAIVIETKDPDDLNVTTWVPLPNLTGVPPGTRLSSVELPRTPYVRPSGRSDEVLVSVKAADSGDPSGWRDLAEPFRLRYVRTRDVSKFVVLSLGTKLPGFDLPNENADQNSDVGRALRGGRVETAAITEVGDMPDQWFGYEAADLVVLTTGATKDSFLRALFEDPAHKPRLDALLEWVRRGGRLVLSLGTNAALVAQYPAFADLLPVAVKKGQDTTSQVDSLPLEWSTRTRVQRLNTFQPRGGAKITVTNFAPRHDRAFRQLVPPLPDATSTKAADPPVVAQGAYGLGRVTAVAFDLDRSPFLEYTGKAEFWDLLTKEAGTAAAATTRKNQNNVYIGPGMQSDTEDELAAAVRTHIDTFEGVPVISFGWVAVFILLYTLLIGPIEYFVLKKVFKRLELTWITFPIIVLTVSAVAYFTAYSLKGDDLKINKMDVVDVDPASGRVYGRTWFTLFSPRIESYTLGIEPNDGWGGKGGPNAPAPLVDWLGGTKSGRGGIFSRRYQYHVDPDTGAFADGLVGVPIQVWSTKAFAADWSARTDGPTPPVVSNLIHPPANRRDVAGTFTLNLPVGELKDVRLVYRGKAYKLDNPITPGVPVTVLLRDSNLDNGWPASANQWGPGQVVTGPAGQRKGGNVFAAGQLVSALFHESAVKATDGSAALGNSSLRRLDQSWRMADDHLDEVVVVGRLDPANGPAEELLAAGGPSPTRLWLKGLPGAGKPREPVRGTLRQETYVRVFVPVTTARK